MNNDCENLTISGLAKAVGVGVETIRYYQRRRLLAEPERVHGAIRRYGSSQLSRLRFIRTAQGLGFSLDEVADLLRLEDGTHCEQASALAEHKLVAVREKIAGLQTVERALSELVHSCHQGGDNIHCPLITSLQDGLRNVSAGK
ncbi:MAG: Hg(II)-responsive transcriptional regulator [Cellvibrionaceae bacterium]